MNQEQILEIREEQQAQFQAPTKPGKKVLQALSNVCHPLLMLTYAAIMLCVFTPLTILPMVIKAYVVGKVFFFTVLLPSLSLLLLHKLKVVGHWALRDRRDRAIPFLINTIFYALNAYSLIVDGFLSNWVMIPFYGSIVLMLVAWIVSFWWKISAHASGNASFATMALILFVYFPETMPLWFCLLSIVLTGAVCSIRVYLGRHNLAQVGYGALLGVFCMSMGMALCNGNI